MRNVPPVGSDDTTWPGITPPPHPAQPQPQPQPAQLPRPQPAQTRPAQPPFVQRAPTFRTPRNGPLMIFRLSRAIARLVALALGVVEALLLIRIVLLLLAANPDAPFSSWIYGWTAPLVAPFQGVFPNAAGGQGIVLDVAAILAMIVYALLARLVEAVLRIGGRP